MSLTVTTAANSRRLCAVQDVLAEMPEQVTSVERFVDAASAAIERYCARIFAQQAYSEVLGGHRYTSLMLARTPIVSMTSVSADGQTITDYRVEDAEAGLLYRASGWGWPSATWTLAYIGGYLMPEQSTPSAANGPPLPHDLQRACIETVKVWWQERGVTDRIASKTLGLTGDSISYRISAHRESLPPLARYLVDPYRHWVAA